MNYKDYYIAIDDTDNLTSIGTGEVAENLGNLLNKFGFGTPTPVTRHQLFFNDAIAYTSHNSAMCFELKGCEKDQKELICICSSYLKDNCAKGSDPGLCIVEKNFSDRDELINFGRDAKCRVLTKEDAYSLAQKKNIHLSEHGGLGIGIIGALAGVGLRMSGNDGRYKGQFKVAVNQDNMLVKDLLSHERIDSIQDKNGYALGENEEVFVTEKVKTVRLRNQSVLLVEKVNNEKGFVWKNIDKKSLKEY
ncbi:hypothetical protein SAMN02745751_00097 [Dethiosulfatibacter aminovorans DSM 17477]|uniref:tRNA(Ile2) 2-agmatinylcytidine synthetase n=1 Tax=Dethiosulfatibacter aminovorans DSM 17477 TaxID=1121476 RepID=A0A1M6AET1_9FIRM|nr:hypothetical protein [Dethiosulfatibacter aminovorans]SHI35040.1 hypothetical protein SAMN02745751_00097 [Dethiosulfatibacter aminovorans DSM 17477]